MSPELKARLESLTKELHHVTQFYSSPSENFEEYTISDIKGFFLRNDQLIARIEVVENLLAETVGWE